MATEVWNDDPKVGRQGWQLRIPISVCTESAVEQQKWVTHTVLFEVDSQPICARVIRLGSRFTRILGHRVRLMVAQIKSVTSNTTIASG